MTNKLILQRLQEKGLVYTLDGFNIPNKIVQSVSGKCKLNVEYNREKNLRDNYKNPRPTNKNFDPLMEAFNIKNGWKFKNIPEFPFYVLNRDSWLNMCPDTKYTSGEEMHSIQDTNYFLADYFFPDYSTIIELDSAYHDTDHRKNLDNARDQYLLSEYGITTFRVRGFGYKKGSIEVSQAMDNVKKYLLGLNKNPMNNKNKQVEVFRDNYNYEIYIIENYIETQEDTTPSVIHLGTIIKKIENEEDRDFATKNRESIERILMLVYPNSKITKW